MPCHLRALPLAAAHGGTTSEHGGIHGGTFVHVQQRGIYPHAMPLQPSPAGNVPVCHPHAGIMAPKYGAAWDYASQGNF
jgi:hypothetical protein